MQAQLTFRRFPTTLVLLALAIVAALLLGGALGYVVKPAALVSAPSRVVVVHDGGLYATGDANAGAQAPCIWVNHVKECS